MTILIIESHFLAPPFFAGDLDGFLPPLAGDLDAGFLAPPLAGDLLGFLPPLAGDFDGFLVLLLEAFLFLSPAFGLDTDRVFLLSLAAGLAAFLASAALDFLRSAALVLLLVSLSF